MKIILFYVPCLKKWTYVFTYHITYFSYGISPKVLLSSTQILFKASFGIENIYFSSLGGRTEGLNSREKIFNQICMVTVHNARVKYDQNLIFICHFQFQILRNKFDL